MTPSSVPRPCVLPVDSLRSCCDLRLLPFETTAELEPLAGMVSQPRAFEAVQFAMDLRQSGYNLFVLGPPGMGKHAMVREVLDRRSTAEPVPREWCYVHNFQPPHHPRAISLAPGRGRQLVRDLKQLVEDLRAAIPAALESSEFRERIQELRDEFTERPEQSFQDLAREAEQQGMRLIRTPDGFSLGPVKDGQVLGPDAFDALPSGEQEQIKKVIGELHQKLQGILSKVPEWAKEGRDKALALEREVTRLAVGHLISQVRARYSDVSEVLVQLAAIEADVIENVSDFRSEEDSALKTLGLQSKDANAFHRYEANLLVDLAGVQRAPIIHEDNPTYPNLVGRVEHQTQLGALVTNFTLIRPGALHLANGGYLILEARKLLMQPYAWEGLKRALYAGTIKIESLGQALSLISTVSLEPEPIPLDVKVVLVGDRSLYYLLYEHDPEFRELFKVAADFDEQMDRSPENVLLYARLIGALAQRDKLLPFDRTAVARLVEQAARTAGDVEKLTTEVRSLADLLCESELWARRESRSAVTAVDVERALDAQVRRADRIRERLQREIQTGTILVRTQGAAVAQVNGLSLLDLGNFSFGQPSRITATARLGEGDVIDIQREVELGGAVHSKGVLILSSLLAARYAQRDPLSLTASLVFEQSYGMVDGDSASVAEFCALVSAIGEIPLRQDLAVTGSLDQHGAVQAIGGVNEKIEGFFDVCHLIGLTGNQGVIIPRANVRHLMLRPDVVEAARQGRFHVMAVSTIDEALEQLTDLPAGEPDGDGNYPAGAVNRRVADRLREFAAQRHKLSAAILRGELEK